MEVIIAYAYLWAHGFCSAEDYNKVLNTEFLKSPTATLLTELVERSSSFKETAARIQWYLKEECKSFDHKRFEQTLFPKLREVYYSNKFNLSEFATRSHRLRNDLWLIPGELPLESPFCDLSYASIPLEDWNDEKQTRSLFETLFEDYK